MEVKKRKLNNTEVKKIRKLKTEILKGQRNDRQSMVCGGILP